MALAPLPGQDPFGPPLARRTDPSSSQEAAAELVHSGRRESQQDATLAAVEAHSGLTSAHLAARTGLDRHMLARRLPELERRGLVRRGPVAARATGGRLAGVTWWAVR